MRLKQWMESKMKFKMSQWFTGCILFVLLWIGIIQPIINTWKSWPWDGFFQPFYVFYCMFGWEWPYTQTCNELLTDSPANFLFMLGGLGVVGAIFVVFIVAICMLATYTFKGRLGD